ncbi:hypothetical protein SAMN05444410_108161 [Hydrobacter penzbergensis]|uniref:Uncharacterized protein n=1 Tax=Hydrobacter penzbergensis TaxID=1235997 RepID=A0A8X8IFS1_9BACT|nr:hypothetical protein [Hydrobacter penzbergensis]SDX05666.1 hypothetical protein SAMN05444410_108161 [Hydrobacter penzbergensis]
MKRVLSFLGFGIIIFIIIASFKINSGNEFYYAFSEKYNVPIPFNVEKPMSYEAFKLWSKYCDPDYAEKFCHFSGEPSNGETSVSKPILKKNWKKAKEIFGLQ